MDLFGFKWTIFTRFWNKDFHYKTIKISCHKQVILSFKYDMAKNYFK